MKSLRYRLLGWLIVVAIRGLVLTCRYHRRPLSPEVNQTRGSGRIFALYHAHQITAMPGADKQSGILVSRSRDGDIVVPLIHSGGNIPIRGSSGGRRKGGATAARNLAKHLQKGLPICVTVDGPKGPRGKAQRGVAMLARKADVPVICVSAVCSRRWVIQSSWDRFQIPKPFSRIDLYLDPPIYRAEKETDAHFAHRIEQRLREMECLYDPQEAAAARALEPNEKATNNDLRPPAAA